MAEPLDRRRFLRTTAGALFSGGLLIVGHEAAGGSDTSRTNEPPRRSSRATGDPPTVSWLPAWWDTARVQAHPRLDSGGDPAAILRALERLATETGTTVATRHFRNAGATPRWVGSGEDALALERRFIERTHAGGLRVIAYYWHSSDDEAVAGSPDWICRDSGGEPTTHPKGTYLDLTTAYRERVLDRLRMLVQLGVDGFYFDGEHGPRDGCRSEGGELAPDRSFSERLVETFAYWKESLSAIRQDLVFVISTPLRLEEPTTPLALAAVADAPKTEWPHPLRAAVRQAEEPSPNPSLRRAFGFGLLRDAALGRPPHVWGSGFIDQDHLMGYVQTVVGLGAIADVAITDRDFVPATEGTGELSMPTLAGAMAFNARVAPALAGHRPFGWAGILYPENGPSRRSWRQAVALPLLGAHETLAAAGVPLRFLTARTIAEGALAGLQIVVVPAASTLDAETERSLEEFTATGCMLIRLQPGDDWFGAGHDRAGATLHSRLAPMLEQAPLRVRNLPSGGCACFYRAAESVSVAVINDSAWIRHERRGSESPPRTRRRRPHPMSGLMVEARAGDAEWLEAREVVNGMALEIRQTSSGFAFALPDAEQLAVASVRLARL